MAMSYLTTGMDLSIGAMGSASDDRPKLESCVSIVVDDVDGGVVGGTEAAVISHQQTGSQTDGDEVFDDNTDARSDVSHSSKSSRGSSSREESENRLQQIKDEVRNRRDEFARLLDEHEQVVRELRRIESSSELQNLVQNDDQSELNEAASELDATSDNQEPIVQQEE